MNFLLLLLAIVLIVKFMNLFKFMEQFDGTCINNFYPNFTDSSFSYQTMKDLYDDPSNTPLEISNNLLAMMKSDLNPEKIQADISGFWKDPASEDYPYFNATTCAYSYMDFNSE